MFCPFRPGLLPKFNIKQMTTILGLLGLFNLGLDALPSPVEKSRMEEKINTAAVTVADAIREVELKLKETIR